MGRKRLGEGPADAAGRRQLILAEAAELFAQNGIAATRVRDIGEAAGLLSGSLYYHFDRKEAIVVEILKEALADLATLYDKVRADQEDPAECIRGLIRASFQLVEMRPAAVAIYLAERTYLIRSDDFAFLEQARAGVDELWLDVIRAGVQQGKFREDVDPRTFLYLTVYPIWMTVLSPRRSELTVDELADQFIAVLMGGFETRPDGSADRLAAHRAPIAARSDC